MSDVHLNKPGDETTFLKALGYFRDHGADGVLIAGDGGERAEAVTGRLKPSMAGWFVGREYQVPMVRPATTVFVKAPHAKTHRFKTVLKPVSKE